MVKNDNPAGRLYFILIRAASQKDDIPAEKVWSTVLGTDGTKGLFSRVGLLQDLAQQVKECVSQIPDVNHALYLDSFKNIEKLLDQTNLHQPWRGPKGLLTPVVLKELAFCSDLLSKNWPEEAIPAAELEDISKRVDELFNEVGSSSLDDYLRTLIHDLLETVRRAIAEYQIRGVKGLRETLAHIIAMLLAHIEIFKENEQEKPIRDFFGLIGKLKNAVEFALKVKELGGPMWNYLCDQFKSLPPPTNGTFL